MQDWSTSYAGGPHLFWNPAAISYLAELLLTLVLAAYFTFRTVRDWRQRQLQAPTVLLTLLLAALAPALLTSLLRVLVAGGWVSYAMPWSPPEFWTTWAMPWARPCGSLAAAALVLFAYRFPRPLPKSRREAGVVAATMAVLVLAEIAVALHTDDAMLARESWWRPDWITGWMNLTMIWAAVVFWRQLASAQRMADPPGRPDGWPARFASVLAAVWQRPANREATAARAFVLFTLLPIVHTATLFLPNGGQFGRFPLDIFICWSGLATLSSLSLILIGYLPERSSFLFKLDVISISLLLAAINGAAWIVEPVYVEQYRAPGMPAAGQALAFIPQGATGYAVEPATFAPRPAAGLAVGPEGARIALPFRLRFYGGQYDAAYVSPRGSIGFERIPQPIDAAFVNGAQAAVHPLLVDVPHQGTRILAQVEADRLVVSRIDRCERPAAAGCYRVQTTLHSDGRFEVHYLAMPAVPEFETFSPSRAPWLIGAMPGWVAAERTGAQAFVRDFHRDFLAYLDRFYAPLVGYTIATMLAVMLGMPLLFRGFLIRPLDRLLNGIRRFRNGESRTQVRVSFHDEIGYLTESFNEMARNQTALMQGLEDRVAERVAEIAEMTISNAQLEERNRLSAELHDAVAQSLASASLLAETLPDQLRAAPGDGARTAELLAQMNRHALTEMRLLLKELRGERESERPLSERLRDLARSFMDLHSLPVDCRIMRDAPLPAEVRAMVYRVAQEALNNAVKHSGASRVSLTFEGGDDRARLVVSDDGRGFDAEAMQARDHLGLTIMRDRSRQVGATLEIASSPGQGCTIAMTWQRSRGLV